jgi:large subunit ribosomal protein L22
MSPRKVRLVIDAVRGKSVKDADIRLSLMKKGAALPVLKLLRSAVANAGHNFNLPPESLYVKTITADGGTTLKRSRPRAFGRAAPIRKRTTHITIVVADRADQPVKKAVVKKEKVEKPVVRAKKSASPKA